MKFERNIVIPAKEDEPKPSQESTEEKKEELVETVQEGEAVRPPSGGWIAIKETVHAESTDLDFD